MTQKWRFILLALGMTIIIYVWACEKGWWARFVPHLWVQQIEIEGCERVNHELVAKTASVPPKTSILQLDLKRIAQNVESLPWVRSCEVRRIMPNTLSLHIAERNPVALVHMGRLYYLDEDGTPFAEPNPGDSLDYPVVTGGEYWECPDKECAGVFLHVVHFLRDLRNYPRLLEEGISEIHLDEDNNMTVFTMKRDIVISLKQGQLGLRLRRLEEVLARASSRGLPVQYIVSQCPDRVVVGLKERR